MEDVHSDVYFMAHTNHWLILF